MSAELHRRARLHAIVHGQVQGVNFRAYTTAWAHRLGVSGTVRNLPDGDSVEVVAEAERMALERLLVALHEGPPSARVERVDVTWVEPRHERGGFQVIG